MKSASVIFLFFVTSLIYGQSLLKNSKGNKFNPSIGFNALTLYKNSLRNPETDGFSLQEVELQFSSDVDAYFRAEATIGLHQEESEEEEHSHEFKIDPEVVFVETTSIPKLTVRVGKFYAEFGKYNALHSHALPFIYKSQLQENIFGEESFSEVGLSLSFLAPFSWFSEVYVQALQPTNETLFVDSHHSLAYLLKWKNLWELSDSLTFEVGTSGLSFANHSHGSSVEDKTSLLGADFTFKWRPTKDGRSSSFLWSTEYIHKKRTGSINEKNGGVTTFMRYQFAKRWYTQAQYEFIGFDKSEGVADSNSYAGLIAFIPTEFSSIRAQYDSIHDGQAKDEKRISLQLNVSIGAHPAHQY